MYSTLFGYYLLFLYWIPIFFYTIHQQVCITFSTMDSLFLWNKGKKKTKTKQEKVNRRKYAFKQYGHFSFLIMIHIYFYLLLNSSLDKMLTFTMSKAVLAQYTGWIEAWRFSWVSLRNVSMFLFSFLLLLSLLVYFVAVFVFIFHFRHRQLYSARAEACTIN